LDVYLGGFAAHLYDCPPSSRFTKEVVLAVEVGSEAPDFALRDENGKEFTLSSLRGRNAVLVFYPLAFSSICTKELHDITTAADEYEAAGADVIAISVDSPYTLKAFKRDEQIEAKLLSDFHPKGAVAKQYGAYIEEAGIATRATFVIDKDGKIAHKVVTHPGEARNQDEYLEALAEKCGA
jgi:peroxiredoxin